MDVVIRRALPADTQALTRVAHTAKRYWKYPEDWIRRWRDALTVSTIPSIAPFAAPTSSASTRSRVWARRASSNTSGSCPSRALPLLVLDVGPARHRRI